MPYMHPVPMRMTAHFRNLARGPLCFEIRYNESTPHGLPPSVGTPELAEYCVEGIDNLVSKYDSSVWVDVHFKVDMSGFLKVDQVEGWVPERGDVDTAADVDRRRHSLAAHPSGDQNDAKAKEVYNLVNEDGDVTDEPIKASIRLDIPRSPSANGLYSKVGAST